MRIVVVFVAAVLLLIENGGIQKSAGNTSSASYAAVTTKNVSTPTKNSPTERVDFDSQLKPIFKSKCMPCHFSGGQMYDRLPFDKPETIRKLGTRLFTRIKDEHDRQLINDFLTQTP
jgi:hypothetical protein